MKCRRSRSACGLKVGCESNGTDGEKLGGGTRRFLNLKAERRPEEA